MSGKFTVRTATFIDTEEILKLQSQYLYVNMNEQERQQGFLRTEIAPSDMATLIEEKKAFVALYNSQIVAYALAGSWSFFARWPIFNTMIDRFPNLELESKKITILDSFQYGPVCIDKNYRSQGILEQLFAAIRTRFVYEFPIGLTFVNVLNKRSYLSHTQKLGMTEIDRFHYKESEYYTLAFFTQK